MSDKIESKAVPGSIYEGFESRMKLFRKINRLLKHDDNYIRMIGVTGLSGMGKTTLVNEIVKYAVQEGLFDVTALVVVSKAPNLHKIQNQIAECLGLESGTGDSTDLTQKIYMSLKEKTKRVLIILDDVEAELNLKMIIGIDPLNLRDGDDHRGCKILVTGTCKQVLERMGAQVNFEISALSDAEVRHMFKQILSEPEADLSSTLSLEMMLEHCGGLPLAVSMLAYAFKSGDGVLFKDKDWGNAMQQFQEHRAGPEGAAIFDIINFSYNMLHDVDEKLMFLLCGLLSGKQISLEDLLKYCLPLFIKEGEAVKAFRRGTFDRLLKSLCEFHLKGKTPSPATGVGDEIAITMHELCHDFAMFVGEGEWQTNWLEQEEEHKLEEVTYLSVFCSSSNNCQVAVPERLKCPKLKLLHVHDENHSFTITDNFFQGTNTGLKVLAFNNVQLSPLPSSLLQLINVETLCLDHCCLGEDITMLGELTSLKVLSLAHTNIKQLPIEIRNLTSLVMLDLSNCSQLKDIPPKVLSRLTKLEELRMGNTIVDWKADGSSNNNASLQELMQLKRLSNLDVHVVDPKAFTHGFTLLPDRFNITIGLGHKRIDECQLRLISNDRSLRKVTLNTSLANLFVIGRDSRTWFWLESLFRHAGELNIEQLHADPFKDWLVRELLTVFNFSMLNHLHVRNNAQILHVFGRPEHFKSWQSLTLENLSNMVMICDSLNDLDSLTTLKVDNCPQLDHLFWFSTHNNNLKELELTRCRSLKAILSFREAKLNSLCSLTLQDLEGLTSIAGANRESLLIDAVKIKKFSITWYSYRVLHSMIVISSCLALL